VIANDRREKFESSKQKENAKYLDPWKWKDGLKGKENFEQE